MSESPVARRFTTPTLFSIGLHVGLVALLFLGATPKRSGSVSVMLLEIGGPKGEGLHAQEEKAETAKSRSAPQEKSDVKKIAPEPEPTSVAAERTATAASSETAASNVNAVSANGSTSNAAGERERYFAEITALMNRAKQYPKLALLREEEGDVLLAIDVAADGSILEVRLEKACAFSTLNDAAVSFVKGIGKLPALPRAFGTGAHLHVPLRYRLERR